MRAVVIREIGSFRLEEIPIPEPGKNEVLIKVLVAGLCRTDLKIIEQGHRDLLLPRVPAEEVVGEVIAAGDASGSKLIGAKVYVYPGTSCGHCLPCLRGSGNLCETMRIMGFHRDGGFAEYVTAPVESLIPLPDGLAPDHAVFAEPLSCCLNALELGRLQDGESIGIWGGGPAGTLLARAAIAMNGVPTVMEPDLGRRTSEMYVESPPKQKFDVAVVAVGSASAYKQAMTCLAPRGRLVVFSGLGPPEAEQIIDLNRLHYLEQSITGAYGCSYHHGVQALELIAAGEVRVDDMISHRLPLERLDEALDLVRQRAGMKILIYPNIIDIDQ